MEIATNNYTCMHAGFTKEELKVQLTRTKVLKISGSRAIGDNKWSSFQKDFTIPENCDTNKISAKFEEGILYIRQPKVIVQEHKTEDTNTPASTPPKPAEAPPAPKIESPPKTTPKHDEPLKTTPKVNESKQQDGVKEKKNEEKKNEEKQRKDEKVKKDDDRKVTAGKSEKFSSGVGGYSVVNAAGKLKMEREKVMKIVMVLLAFALGMYVSNKLPNWFSRNV